MTVEINPVGLRCGAENGGLSCAWCYQAPLNGANVAVPTLDIAAITKAVEKINPGKRGFSLFGGEPLLAPMETLEALFKLGLKTSGRNGVQTSGRPITEELWELLKKYKTTVSFSIEGPGELNDSRWAGSIKETRKATAHSIGYLMRALKEGVPTGLITTLYRKNASAERLPRLKDWFRELDKAGLSSVCLHILQHEGSSKYLGLSQDETYEAVVELHKFERELKQLRFMLFRDIRALLLGKDTWKWNDGSAAGVTCTWSACDPWRTPAVQGIEPDGSRSLCQRVHDSPVQWTPTSRGPLVRQLALASTPQENGGCKDCRQLITCKGQCPGTALDGDWRKRSRDCEFWKRILEYFEGVLQDAGERPITLRSDLKQLESIMISHWAQGRTASLVQVLKDTERVHHGCSNRMKPGQIPCTCCHHDANDPDHGDHTDHGDHDDLNPILSSVEREKVND